MRRFWEVQCLPDLVSHPPCVLQDISVTCNSVGAHCCDVLDAVIDSVDRGAAFKSTRVQTVFNACNAVSASSSKVADGAAVADGGTDGPAAIAAFDVGDTTSLIGVPDIDATSCIASAAVAAEASKDLVHKVHVRLELNYI